MMTGSSVSIKGVDTDSSKEEVRAPGIDICSQDGSSIINQR